MAEWATVEDATGRAAGQISVSARWVKPLRTGGDPGPHGLSAEEVEGLISRFSPEKDGQVWDVAQVSRFVVVFLHTGDMLDDLAEDKSTAEGPPRKCTVLRSFHRFPTVPPICHALQPLSDCVVFACRGARPSSRPTHHIHWHAPRGTRPAIAPRVTSTVVWLCSTIFSTNKWTAILIATSCTYVIVIYIVLILLFLCF